MISHDPIADVNVMDVLFANVIAAQPDVMVPIANLLLHFGVAVFPAMPDGAAVDPVCAQGHHIANRAILDAFDGFKITGLMAALRAGGDLEVFLLRQFGGPLHQAATRTVHRDRLLAENVFAGLDASPKVRRAEPRRGGKDGVVDARDFQRLLVSVKPAEAFVFRHVEVFLPALGLFGEDVRYGHNLGFYADALCGLEEVLACAAPSATYADNDGVDGLLGLGMEDGWEVHRGGCGSGNQR